MLRAYCRVTSNFGVLFASLVLTKRAVGVLFRFFSILVHFCFEKAIDHAVSTLSSYKPKINLLTTQLRREQQQLDEFTATLARLRQIQVHQSLKDFLLPELPPHEVTGSLADWANANELLTTHDVLSTDLKQMEVRFFDSEHFFQFQWPFVAFNHTQVIESLGPTPSKKSSV